MRSHPVPFVSSARRERHLQAARLAGAAAAAVVAQVLVDMPDGYFGSADEITAFGAVYAAAVAGTVAAVLTPWRHRPRWAPWTAVALLAVSVGVFVPALAADPFVAGLTAAWNLWVLATFLFPRASRGRYRIPPGKEPELDAWLTEWSPAVAHLAVVALVVTAAVVGHRLSGRWLPLSVCLALNLAVLAAAARLLLLLVRARRRGVFVVVLPLVAALFFLGRPPALFGLLATFQLFLLVQLFGHTRMVAEVIRDFLDRPARLILAFFLALILVGTVLLGFPAAASAGGRVAAMDALFTATSAVCVTGLIVLDTPHDFSPFGHAVILGLIQLGGLGIMVLSTFAALALGGSLGMRGEEVLRQSLEAHSGRAARRLTLFIVVSTLAIEALGALALAGAFHRGGEPLARSLWLGLFHAVSAFCNAGFALMTDSLIGFQREPATLAVFALLIVLGGVGFAVLAAFAERVTGRFKGGRRGRWPVQAKVVLAMSAALAAAGWILYALCEWNHSLVGLAPGHKLVNALFQSVTARTAGFNSVEMSLTPAALLVTCALMFVGASPGSTGGGIKTTTAAALLAAVRATVRGGGAVVFGRELPRATVDRSLAIVVAYVLGAGGGLFALALVEAQPLDRLAFEVVSALGTVGLSAGATAELTAPGKLIVTMLMLAGRVGPLTLALFVATGGARAPAWRHPRASMMVG
ncbi:MAG TPA: potassium transporter TrkG [Thermoanaerobaculia bacterium]